MFDKNIKFQPDYLEVENQRFYTICCYFPFIKSSKVLCLSVTSLTSKLIEFSINIHKGPINIFDNFNAKLQSMDGFRLFFFFILTHSNTVLLDTRECTVLDILIIVLTTFRTFN